MPPLLVKLHPLPFVEKPGDTPSLDSGKARSATADAGSSAADAAVDSARTAGSADTSASSTPTVHGAVSAVSGAGNKGSVGNDDPGADAGNGVHAGAASQAASDTTVKKEKTDEAMHSSPAKKADEPIDSSSPPKEGDEDISPSKRASARKRKR